MGMKLFCWVRSMGKEKGRFLTRNRPRNGFNEVGRLCCSLQPVDGECCYAANAGVFGDRHGAVTWIGRK